MKSPKESTAARQQIADLLMKGRAQSELCLDEAAELLKIDTDLLLSFETGQKQIPLRHIFAAANIYNINPSVILEILTEFDLNHDHTDAELLEMDKISV